MSKIAFALVFAMALVGCRTPRDWTAGPVPAPDSSWDMSQRMDTFARYVPERLSTQHAFVRENDKVIVYNIDSYRSALDSLNKDLHPELMSAKKWSQYWTYSYIAMTMLGSAAIARAEGDPRKYAAYAGAAIAGGFTLYFGGKSKSIIEGVTWKTHNALEKRLLP